MRRRERAQLFSFPRSDLLKEGFLRYSSTIRSEATLSNTHAPYIFWANFYKGLIEPVKSSGGKGIPEQRYTWCTKHAHTTALEVCKCSFKGDISTIQTPSLSCIILLYSYSPVL